MNTPIDPHTALRLTRIFRAPPDRVFAAWTDPEQLKQWHAPEGVQTLSWQVDLRVGGQWRWEILDPDGDQMVVFGEYREINPGKKLAYTWRWKDDSTWENRNSLVTLEFRPHPEGTEFTLTHEKLPNEESRNGHTRGWTSALEKLGRFLSP